MQNGNDERNDQQINVSLQKCLLDRILILFIFIFTHQVSHDIEAIPHLLGTVHLPLEHTQRLVRDTDVQSLDRLIDRHVLLVQIPVVVQVQDWLVILHTGRELDEFV